MFNAFLLEKHNIKAELPVDLNTAGLVGARIKMDKAFRLAVVVNLGGSTGATVQVALKQHNAASGGTTKDLEVANKYFKKVGAATVFTQVEPTAKEDTYDLSADFANAAGVVVMEILAEDLDVSNGYAWVSVEIADSAVAKLGSVLYIAHECKDLPAYAVAL